MCHSGRATSNWVIERILGAIAREHRSRVIATGHHLDDQVETVLMRWLRGSGSRGLAGIPTRRPLGEGICLVRPLLGVGRTAMLLAFSPGGLAEMSLMALSLGIEVAFVASHHVARILFIVLVAPPLFAAWRRASRDRR